MNHKSITVSLEQLHQAGLDIRQHEHDPQPDEWYVNMTIGPFTTAEEALVKGIHWIYSLYQEYKELYETS